MRLSLPKTLVGALLLLLCGAAPAFADTANSSNWAGYAVHRSGVKFSTIVAAWQQPSANCTPGRQTFSAIWVGLGGFSPSSNALEQIGSEVDCTAGGRVSSSAWYELVPAPSHSISLRVRPGDVLMASVTVTGHTVAVELRDATTHKSFRKTLQASSVDVSSAEWIVEAPSDCINASACQTLPLADFGSATFSLARARSTTGHLGAISDRAWNTTKISLAPSGRRFVVSGGAGAPFGTATPSALTSGGTSFSVTFANVNVQGNPFLSQRRAAVRAGYIVHGRR